MNFRTNIPPVPVAFNLTHSDKLLVMGSCFAEHTGVRLRESGFKVALNPYGVLYNPLSMEKALRRLMTDNPFTASELMAYNGLYHSFNHHGSFSNADAGKALSHINAAYASTVQALKQASCLMLTFGTAWIYRLSDTGAVVANCHKLPANCFLRQRLTVDDIIDPYTALFDDLLVEHPGLKIVLTVSPIRHVKDGLHANNLSKALLLLASEALSERFPNVLYYPAYELLMDDLRDYRFYTDDMLHPSTQALSYVWEHFSDTFFNKQTKEVAKQVQQVRKAMEHRPFQPEEAAYYRFAQKNLAAIEGLLLSAPGLNLHEEKAFFERIIRGR